MNFLKKKLKPLTSGLTQTNQAAAGQTKRGAGTKANKDLEDDLYDEYVVEAPPHPSELLALGVEPSEIDVNDPDKLRELYKKALEEGKASKTNSVLLARQRQKEELEEKKKTREEWKFFESLTTRVEQVVKTSQKNLDLWKETSAVDQLAEPDYELRQTADEVFKPVNTSKIEKGADSWIDFDEDQKKPEVSRAAPDKRGEQGAEKQVDEFGCPLEQRKDSLAKAEENFVVKELLEDFGLDLRTEAEKKALEKKKREEEEARRRRELEEAAKARAEAEASRAPASQSAKSTVDIKAAARPRPRPKPAAAGEAAAPAATKTTAAPPEEEPDPFNTSFVAPVVAELIEPDGLLLDQAKTAKSEEQASKLDEPTDFVDPFDTSHVKLA